MPRLCSICEHPNRPDIDEALLHPQSIRGGYRSVARTFRLSEDAMYRHKKEHLAIPMAASREMAQLQAVNHGDALVTQVLKLQQKAENILDDAEAAGKPLIALTALREIRELIKLQGNLLGQLGQQQNIHVDQLIVHQEWQHLQVAIIGALADFPDARDAVQHALEGTLHAPE